MKPDLEWLYDADVEIAPRRDLGPSPAGHRYIVDILGGSFEGPRMSGKVIPGGADRQLVMPDGVRLLNAIYEMETVDGAMLTVQNRVVIDESAPGGRYARSSVQLLAPDGRYGWLNRRVFIGTLTSLRPAREAVRIGVFLLN